MPSNARDCREEVFRTKFADAAQALGAAPADVVSLKLRDTVGSYSDSEYDAFFRALEHDLALPLARVQSTFQGRAHLVGDDHAKVVLVEHETGLEILYIAGSVASLLGLIPTLLRIWHVAQGRFSRQHHLGPGGIEVHRLDDQGHLKEESLHGLMAAPLLGLGGMDPILESLTKLIEGRISDLADQVRCLATRVDALEKQRATAKPRKPRATKKAP
jgi:hypothetical protein